MLCGRRPVQRHSGRGLAPPAITCMGRTPGRLTWRGCGRRNRGTRPGACRCGAGPRRRAPAGGRGGWERGGPTSLGSSKGNVILSYPILSYPILSYPELSYPELSYPWGPAPVVGSIPSWQVHAISWHPPLGNSYRWTVHAMRTLFLALAACCLWPQLPLQRQSTSHPPAPRRTLTSPWPMLAPFLAKRQPRPLRMSSSQAASTLPERSTAPLMQ
jgi:hypothetical protein